MPYEWPADTDFAHRELVVIDRARPACGRMMYICDHRYRRIHTLFVTGIAAEFPGVPHRYCDNHFLRDLAKPVLEGDSHSKKKRPILLAELERRYRETPLF